MSIPKLSFNKKYSKLLINIGVSIQSERQNAKRAIRVALSILLLLISTSVSNTFGQVDSISVNSSSLLQIKSLQIDSLAKLYRNNTKDSLRVNLLYEIIEHYDNIQYNAIMMGKYEKAYDALWNIFDLFNDQETQKLLKRLDLQHQKMLFSNWSNTIFNYGRLMGEIENPIEQIDYYMKSYLLAKEWQDTINIAYSLTSTAFVYKEENKLDSAQYYLNKVKEYIKEHKSYYFYVYYMVGTIKLAMGEFDQAKGYFFKGIDNTNRFGITPEVGQAINFLGLSKVYMHLNHLDSSYLYGIEALRLLKTIKEIPNIRVDLAYAYENMFQYFQHYPNRDSAFYYLNQFNIERSFLSNKKIKILANFQQALLKKQLFLKDLQREKIETKGRIRMLITSGLLLIFIAFGSVLFYFLRQKQKSNILLQSTLTKLKSSQAQLIQSEKMASLGELTAGIAHEIQNPLNFVNNFSDVNIELIEEMKKELAAGNRPLAEEIAEDIKSNEQKINHHGKRADGIVKGMLQHSRTSSGQKEMTDINALADEYLKLAYHGLQAKDKSFNAKFETHLDPTLPKLNVIPQDMGRVLLNLINNAFYAVSEKQKAQSTKPGSGYDPSITVSTKNLGGKIEISVRDNGNGIPDSIKEKIFQPFFTTKPTGQGTGLGLSLSYDIVKAHGGELKVETKESLTDDPHLNDTVGQADGRGEGCQFIIQLPINQN